MSKPSDRLMAEDIEYMIQGHQVHRDVYTSRAVYDAEMRHLFANAWVFVGQESNPKEGRLLHHANREANPLYKSVTVMVRSKCFTTAVRTKAPRSPLIVRETRANFSLSLSCVVFQDRWLSLGHST